MDVQFLNDNKEQNEMWFSFSNNGQDYIMIVGTTDKPFRGVSEINGIYEDEQQNNYANPPADVVSEAYAGVLGESVKHL